MFTKCVQCTVHMNFVITVCFDFVFAITDRMGSQDHVNITGLLISKCWVNYFWEYLKYEYKFLLEK